MAIPALKLVSPAPRLDVSPGAPAEPLCRQIPCGRLVELSGVGPVARTTTATRILVQAQREGETAVWIQPAHGSLYPPDLERAGADLSALVVIHVPDTAGPHGLYRAAEIMLRSGAFGLLILDPPAPTMPRRASQDTARQGRLLALAREHQTRLLLLSHAGTHADSLGPLVTLRVESRRMRIPRGFALEHQVLKNKSGAPFTAPTEPCGAPAGL